MHFDTAIAVIPARYQSTRFPGKPLAPIAGVPMIKRVYDNAARLDVARVLVATDDRRIFDYVESFGGQVVMTSPDHRTGTDRIAEAVGDDNNMLVLNIQGDEPLLPLADINGLINDMRQKSDAEMATIAVPIDRTSAEFTDPNVVKVALDRNQYALYFSRAPVPHHRAGHAVDVHPLRHWGVYAFRRRFLDAFVRWPQGRLEITESLEQLRAIENGARIFVRIAQTHTAGVDVPEDISKVEALLESHDICPP